jgi:hypothetical protein
MLHDIMLERGVRFARRERIAVKERGIELAVFFGKGRALAKMGRLARVLIFATQEEKEAFEKSLGTDLDSTRIKIAISNGKLRLAAATRQELEALLP